MTVIINEFEITPAQQTAAPPQPAESAPPPPAQPPAQEAMRIIRRQVERQLRLWAH